MSYPPRPIAFVLAASNHGSMIVNRNDYRMIDARQGYGVGFQILSKSCFDPDEIRFALALLDCRRKFYGDGVIALDGGANIGVHTIEWSRHMHGWGEVTAFEAQETVFYALAGNIALNNCLNARARNAALGAVVGEIEIPKPNYLVPASFGSLELRAGANNEFIGQKISYEPKDCTRVSLVSIDSLALARLDLLKIDVEGMELDVLQGADATLMRHKPVLIVEAIKADRAQIETVLTRLNYKIFPMGLNLLGIHAEDPTLQRLSTSEHGVVLATV